MKVGRWSTTAANNNATPPDGWPEGQAPSTVNDCARENMAAIKTAMQDMDFFDHDFTPTFINANSFSVPGDQTARIVAGRQLKLFDATTHVRAVGSASFTTVTTISLGAGTALTSSLSSFAVGIINPNNSAIPNNFNRISASAIETTTLTASGAVVLLSTLSVNGAIVANSTLSLSGAATLNATLSVSGATVLNTTLNVQGATSLSGAVVLLSTLSVDGAVALGTTLSVSGAAVLKSTLSIGGAVNLASTLTVGGATVLSGALSVGTSVTIGTTLSVSGAVVLKSNLSVGGIITNPQVAKAWCAFSGVGVVTLQQSFNVASITDNGVGDYTINLTNALSGSGYAILGFAEFTAGGDTLFVTHPSNGVKTTSGYSIQTIKNLADAVTDASVVCMGFFGT